MRTKKTSTEKFVQKATEWGDKLLSEKQGYILLCYNEIDDDRMMTSITNKGSIGGAVECLHLCMNKNPLFANIVMAAANSFVQARAMQEELQKEITENVEM